MPRYPTELASVYNILLYHATRCLYLRVNGKLLLHVVTSICQVPLPKRPTAKRKQLKFIPEEEAYVLSYYF